MTRLDDMLEQLRDRPAPAALMEIDASALVRIARSREQSIVRNGLALAGAVAVLIGAAGSLASPAQASGKPLFGIPDTAPSRLLAE